MMTNATLTMNILSYQKTSYSANNINMFFFVGTFTHLGGGGDHGRLMENPVFTLTGVSY